MKLRPRATITGALMLSAFLPALASEAAVDFARDVEPIFKASCVECHGADKQKGDLRLDNREAAMRGGTNGVSIVLHDHAKSLLIKRVLGEGDDPRMPKKKDPLSAQQIAVLERWIDQGASWPERATTAAKEKRWSYVPPRDIAPPAVKDKGWIRNPIDSFIMARLEREGLAPEGEADRATLLRRVSLDLTGLPPSPAQVDAYIADRAPDAYERQVDQLLASPHYGERWARPWLDLARYADTQGYEKDNRRSQWPYRDWVIDAFNSDMPFDQFTIEQLAGDMLPNATRSQQIATGFHRNTMINEEGGVDAEEMRWNSLVDRVGTTAEVWLGSTMQCAQCHNHKYDPFLQRDFYQLLAFFDNADEPLLTLTEERDAPTKTRLQGEIGALKEAQAAAASKLGPEQADWEAGIGTPPAWSPLEILEMSTANGTVLSRLPDGSLLASKAAAKDTYILTTRSALPRLAAVRLEVLPDQSLPASGPGASGNGNFVLSEIAVELRTPGGKQPISLTGAHADFSQKDWPVAHAIDGKLDTGWAIQPETGKAHAASFACAPLDLPAGATLVVTLSQQSPYAQHIIGRLRLSVSSRPDNGGAASLPKPVQAILNIVPAQRSPAQIVELAEFYRTISPTLAESRTKLASLETQIAPRTIGTTMVMRERAGDAVPTTHVHIRGAYLVKGDLVQAGVPAILPPLNPAVTANRLALARWLVDGGNPLTARVTVNRFWEQIFGKGIVESSEDFGVQGQPPSHSELLDWLAGEFVHSHWKVKALHRLIVTSATYRQSARSTAAKLERDPANRLLARGPRFRIEAEMVRDVALAASGLLSGTVGGPSVFPYQPEGIWNIPYNGDKWTNDPGEDRYRRGIYTFWRRTSPYPAFITFDAPSREVCTLKRPRTNTPLQALTVLNDPAFVEAARALARRMLRDGGETTASRCALGYRLCCAHPPSGADLAILVKLHDREQERYRLDPAAAKELIAGDAAADQASDLAGLIVVANALLNLDETISKE
jgi:mono/diheme cytochrome c family protein